MSAGALYVHVPFCAQRCGYCDFSLLAGRDQHQTDYLAAIRRELQRYALPQPLATIYVGGGTPSHLPDRELTELFQVVRDAAVWANDAEVTLEANPNDIDPRRSEIWRSLGVNRLSVGVQSFRDDKLRRLERTHSAEQARGRIAELAAAGWNVSLDLMFGLAGETQIEWRREIDQAVELGVQHLSVYNLTIEKGTQFWNRTMHGESLAADEEEAAELYEAAVDRLVDLGMEHYEISNFARPGFACRHNLTYWRGTPWLGLGPGAASYVDRIRWRNYRSPLRYFREALAGRAPVESLDRLSAEQAAREALIFGMRQIAGIEVAAFQNATGWSPWELGGQPLQNWLESGLVQSSNGRLALTRRGLLISDALWPELI